MCISIWTDESERQKKEKEVEKIRKEHEMNDEGKQRENPLTGQRKRRMCVIQVRSGNTQAPEADRGCGLQAPFFENFIS